MKHAKLFAASGVVALASLLPPALAADGSRTSPPAHKRYVGIDLGSSRASGGLSGAETTEGSNGFAIRFGYQFNRYLAAEIGYEDFGDFTFDVSPSSCPGRPPGGCDVTTRSSISGPLINVVALIPLSDQWTLKGRAGVFHADVSSHESGAGAPVPPPNISESNNGLHFGAGVSYHLNDNLEIEAAWAYFEQLDLGLNLGGSATVFSDGSTSMASVGIAYRF